MSRVFDGKPYDLVTYVKTKEEAKRTKERLKNSGHSVRVIKYKGGGYNVYQYPPMGVQESDLKKWGLPPIKKR